VRFRDQRHLAQEAQARANLPKDDAIQVTLGARVVPTAAWIAKGKELQAAGQPIPDPADDEKEVAVILRGHYMVHSDLVPPEQWPVVNTDLGEVARVSMASLKRRVKEALEKDGNSLAGKIHVTESVTS